MINEYIQSLISTREILLSILFSISCLFVVHYYLFSNYSLKTILKYWFGTIVTLVINIKLLLILYFVVFFFFKYFVNQFLALSVLFSLVYFINLSLQTVLGIKYASPKAKKIGGLNEILSSIYGDISPRTVNLFIMSLMLILSGLILGNGKIDILLILLFLSVVVSSISVLFILPLILETFDKLFNLLK